MAKKPIAIDDTLSNMFSGDGFSNVTDEPLTNTRRRRRSVQKDTFDEEAVVEANKSNIVAINIGDLRTHRHHTFQVKDDEDMRVLVESIKEVGIIVPLIVRKVDDDGTYELISGHRRKHAAELAGLKEVPCIILDIDDDTSDIYMVDANAQRERILPSEKAKSYKLKYEAMKRQGKKVDMAEDPSEDNEDSDADDSTSSRDVSLESKDEHGERQVRRYIRLANLHEDLLELVDNDNIGIAAGYTLTFLTKPDQQTVADAVTAVASTTGKPVSITTKNAENIKKVAKTSKLTTEKVIEVLNGTRKGKSPNKEKKAKLDEKTLNEHFPNIIAAAPTEAKIEYTKHALDYFNKYIEDHPEEMYQIGLFK